MYAAMNRKDLIVRLLLNRGASPNIRVRLPVVHNEVLLDDALPAYPTKRAGHAEMIRKVGCCLVLAGRLWKGCNVLCRRVQLCESH